MKDDLKYLFDLNGYVLLENIISPSEVTRINQVIASLEQCNTENFPPNVIQGKPRTPEELFVSNVVEADPAITALVDIEPVIDIIKFVTCGLFRLNHSYSLSHWKDAQTPLHMGGTPIHPKANYHCTGDQIFSCVTKAAFPIANHRRDDGCFAVVPGSHKSSFPSPYGTKPDEHPSLIPIDATPGDAIVFTEAMTHGSLQNLTGNCRRSVFLVYSVGYMPDWTKFGLRFSDEFTSSLDDRKKEIVRLKVD